MHRRAVVHWFCTGRVGWMVGTTKPKLNGALAWQLVRGTFAFSLTLSSLPLLSPLLSNILFLPLKKGDPGPFAESPPLNSI